MSKVNLSVHSDQHQTLKKLVRDAFDATNDPEEMAHYTQLMKDINHEDEAMQMLKDVLIPNEKRSSHV